MRLVLISDCNLQMLLPEIEDEHGERKIFDKVRCDVLEKLLRLSKVIELHVYNLVDGALSEDWVYNLLNSWVYTPLLASAGFMISSLK